jgi:hypothetical protein
MARSPARRDKPRLSWFAVLWACVWGGFTLVFLFVAIAQWTGLDPAWDPEVVLGAVATALFTGTVAAAGVVMARVRRSNREPLVEPPTPPTVLPPGARTEKRFRLPRPKSSARQPMMDLAEAEAGLAELMLQLTELPDGPVVPEHVIEQARQTATDTATKLRSVAARLEAVELAVKHAPASEWAALEEGTGSLRRHLDQGLEAYRSLIAATGRVVLASTPLTATTELVEATESLAGLAAALQELSTPDA